jgi:hypothetical protein
MGSHSAEGTAADPKCFFEDGVEYPCKIARRGVDDLQHFGSRSLLLKRLVKFSLTLGKPAPQIGYQLLRIA